MIRKNRRGFLFTAANKSTRKVQKQNKCLISPTHQNHNR